MSEQHAGRIYRDGRRIFAGAIAAAFLGLSALARADILPPPEVVAIRDAIQHGIVVTDAAQTPETVYVVWPWLANDAPKLRAFRADQSVLLWPKGKFRPEHPDDPRAFSADGHSVIGLFAVPAADWGDASVRADLPASAVRCINLTRFRDAPRGSPGVLLEVFSAGRYGTTYQGDDVSAPYRDYPLPTPTMCPLVRLTPSLDPLVAWQEEISAAYNKASARGYNEDEWFEPRKEGWGCLR